MVHGSGSSSRRDNRATTILYPDTSNGIALLFRTDFSDGETWAEIAREAAMDRPIPGQEEWGPDNVFLNPGIRPISDRQLDGMTVAELLEVAPDPPVLTDEQLRNPQGEPDVTPLHAYIADTMTMTHPDHPILAVNFFLDRGENCRLIPAAVAMVECNFSVGNLGFDDFTSNENLTASCASDPRRFRDDRLATWMVSQARGRDCLRNGVSGPTR